jgi:hypothetical protein
VAFSWRCRFSTAVWSARSSAFSPAFQGGVANRSRRLGLEGQAVEEIGDLLRGGALAHPGPHHTDLLGLARDAALGVVGPRISVDEAADDLAAAINRTRETNGAWLGRDAVDDIGFAAHQIDAPRGRRAGGQGIADVKFAEAIEEGIGNPD